MFSKTHTQQFIPPSLNIAGPEIGRYHARFSKNRGFCEAHGKPFFTVPPLCAYCMSKFVLDSLASYVAAEYPTVTTVSRHRGLVPTDMLRAPFRSLFNQDSPELAGGTALWLCQEKAKFLSGRFIAAGWNVEDLVKTKEEIVKDPLLKLTLKGQLDV